MTPVRHENLTDAPLPGTQNPRPQSTLSAPPLRRIGEIVVDASPIPVWRTADEAAAFVRYCDMPSAVESAFRAQQVLAGKPFAGAAYVEDFQLFVDLRRVLRN